MNQVDALHDGRYKSQVLCSTITIYLGDIEVRDTDLDILCLDFG